MPDIYNIRLYHKNFLGKHKLHRSTELIKVQLSDEIVGDKPANFGANMEYDIDNADKGNPEDNSHRHYHDEHRLQQPNDCR